MRVKDLNTTVFDCLGVRRETNRDVTLSFLVKNTGVTVF